ncbi:ferredoxin [Haloarcula sp. GH36]|uniref:ferredoxin n=1 Tax=Haloarcula montana TaxID=3111776 RepID=UPI002D778E55|nr:ferredoxin [Haloarcula sp. GH36]
MTTEYQVRLDRAACDGIFACLVRDDRFVEAEDGLAAIESDGEDTLGDHDGDGNQLVTFDDDRLEAAQQAASACPVDAIDVVREGADE